MTIKRAVLITLLSASVVGLLAIGIKTNSFSKENIKNSFKIQDNSSHKHRKAPIKVNAEDNNTDLIEENYEYTAQVIAENGENYQNQTKKYQLQNEEENTQQNLINNSANIKYTAYTKYGQSQSIQNQTYLYHYALLKINNYKYSNYTLTDKIGDITINFLPNISTAFTYNVVKDIYTYDNFSEQLFNIDISNINPITSINTFIQLNTDYEHTQIIDPHTRQPTSATSHWHYLNNTSIETDQFYINSGATKFIIFKLTLEVTQTQSTTLSTSPRTKLLINNIYANHNYEQEVIPITSLMFDILTMPFSFITQAFNVTLWEGTPYQFNFSNFILSLIAVATLLFIIKLFTSGMGIIGNYTGKINNNIQKSKKSKPQKPKKDRKE